MRRRKKSGFIRKRWNKRGSYSVEAAFIVPIVLGICFTVLYTLFLLHDRCVLAGNVHEVLMLSAAENLAEENCQEYLEKPLWCMDVTAVQRKESGGSVRFIVQAEADIKIPVMNIFMKHLQKFTLQASYPVRQPDGIIRYRREEESCRN